MAKKHSFPKSTNSSAEAQHRQVLAVSGMTCRSCELLIERKLKKVSGVKEVWASERKATVEILSEGSLPAPTLEALQEALGESYTLHDPHSPRQDVVTEQTPREHWMEVGGMLIVVTAIALILRKFGVLQLSSTMENVVSLGTVFVVGLVAASSTCLAVVGGLLLSVAAKYNESFPSANRWRKFLPLLQFNLGRLIGYFLFGGLIGLLGNALSPSPKATGFITIAIAIVMLILGLNILKILPKRYCSLPLPRSWTARLHALEASHNPLMPSLLGAFTFFLPCGFTQSMQLLSLQSGNFLGGGIIMLVFALGTLPALLGISIVSSVAEGRFGKLFLSFSGVTVLLLGFFNLQNGFVLAGFNLPVPGTAVQEVRAIPSRGTDPAVTINAQGQQIISLSVSNTGYSPTDITIDANTETWIYATALQPVGGCASMLTAPAFNLSTPIRVGGNWLGPISAPKNDFVVACSMGMMRANIHVRPS
jgi:sulfite exporter TauE/SafE/copper chaperone CopZ